jgi:hypothetical protein
MTRPPQTELRKPADLYSGCVWPLMCFFLGRESASIWLSKLDPPGQVHMERWDVLGTNGEYEIKVNGYTGKVISIVGG